jgi:hypothetical protein
MHCVKHQVLLSPASWKSGREPGTDALIFMIRSNDNGEPKLPTPLHPTTTLKNACIRPSIWKASTGLVGSWRGRRARAKKVEMTPGAEAKA